MSIQNRFLFIAIVVALSMATLNILLHFSMNSVAGLKDSEQLVTEIEVSMLTLRRNEKDFLARKDLKYLDEFKKHFSQLQQQLSALMQRLGDTHISNGKTTELAAILDQYAKDFNLIADAEQLIGLDEKSGFRGSLRNAVHSAEGKLKEVDNDTLLKNMLTLRRHEKDFLLRSDLKYVGRFNQAFSVMLETLGTTIIPETVKSEIEGQLTQYRSGFLKLVEAQTTQGLSSKEGLMGKMRDTVHKSETLLETLAEDTRRAAEREISGKLTTATLFSITINVLIFIAIIYFTRRIVIALTGMTHLIAELSHSHDLSRRMAFSNVTEINHAAKAFNTLMDSFQNTIRQMANATFSIANTSNRMSQITEQTKNGMLRQQCEIEQVASAMNEMNSSVAEVASNTIMAADSAQLANEESYKSRQVMEQTMDTINGLAREVEAASSVINHLEEKSEGIGAILDVIRGIADQTNLLALNAAIEAARAGEQGRGFAVVADEVRTLASRTQQSTQQIQQMISEFQTGAKEAGQTMNSGYAKATEGVVQVKKAYESLQTIARMISSINDLNAQIATASEEQTSVTNEMNSNISNINLETSQTSESAIATAQISEELADLSAHLQKHIATFKVAEGGFDFEQAKAAHLAWRARLRGVLDGRESLSQNEVTSHKHCALGQWYYSTGLQNFAHVDGMRALEQPHKELHELIKLIVKLQASGDKSAAEREYKKVDALSSRIVALLDQISRQAKQ